MDTDIIKLQLQLTSVISFLIPYKKAKEKQQLNRVKIVPQIFNGREEEEKITMSLIFCGLKT